MQNYFGSGSTALMRMLGSFILARVAEKFIVRLKLFSKMGTVHWIGLQTQCYIPIQKHSVRYGSL